jgi:hypothetical protein
MTSNVDFSGLQNLTKDQVIQELERAFTTLDKWVTTIQNPVNGEVREVWRETHEVLTDITKLLP